MLTKLIVNYSPNFSSNTRNSKKVKFLVFHYTGMNSEKNAILRLTDDKSKVSAHYFIKRNGEIISMVPDLHTAWHAGKSRWKNYKSLNKNSIGIELVNKRHQFGYQNYTHSQIKSLINLCKKIKKKYKIKRSNFLGHSDISPQRKIDPGEKFPWEKLSKFKFGLWYKKKDLFDNFKEKKKYKSLFFKNLHKIGYRYFQLKKRVKGDKLVIKAFQRRYYPQKVTGTIDQKTLKISCFLADEYIKS